MPVDEIVPYARRADALGFDVFTMSEHLQYAKPTCDPWTALTWVAAQTTRIRVGSNALCVPNREPAVLAKMAATLDRLSGGRAGPWPVRREVRLGIRVLRPRRAP